MIKKKPTTSKTRKKTPRAGAPVRSPRNEVFRHQEFFFRLMRLIANSGSDLDKLTGAVAEVTAKALGDSSMISLLNTDGEKVHIAAFHDTDSIAASLIYKLMEATAEYPRDEGLTGRVLRSGEPILISSIPRKQLLAVTLPDFVEYIKRVGVKSVLVVPLVGRSGVLGVISLARHRGSKSYTPRDQAFLTEISFRAAMAIENCTLFESLRAEINRQNSTKEALDASEEHFRSIFEATTLGVQILDMVGTVMNANPACQKMLGYSEAELIGRNFQDFLHPEDVHKVLRPFNELKLNGYADRPFEHRALHKDGSSIWVKTLFSGVRHGGANSSLEFVVSMSENITDQKQLQLEMVELKNRLQDGQELERLRLAHELHDGPIQDLHSERFRIEELRKQANPPLREGLEELSRNIEKVIESLRNSAKELRPPTLSSFGLETAIRSYMRDFQEKHPTIRVHLSLARDQQLLPEEMRLTLFRVLQQAVMNVARHSNATQVWVNFSFDEGQVSLKIRDNGKGFTVPSNWIALVRNRHYGLAGMAERITGQGGVFTVESAPNKPTIVEASMPWNGKKPEIQPFDETTHSSADRSKPGKET